MKKKPDLKEQLKKTFEHIYKHGGSEPMLEAQKFIRNMDNEIEKSRKKYERAKKRREKARGVAVEIWNAYKAELEKKYLRYKN
jgi:TATA-binding protein-associated factor Taf7